MNRLALSLICAFRLVLAKLLSASGDGEIRTLDPLLARQVLSQLSYTPMRTTIQTEKGFLLSYGLKWAFPLLRDYPMGLSGPFLC